ncbi:MAG: hypothetical protein QM704_12880 [Anaeromyxobacteraceae bacterium]
MNSQIAKRSAPPPRGLWQDVREEWLAGLLLSVVWVALWSLFMEGVVGPAGRLARHGSASEPDPQAQPARWVGRR